MGRPRKSPSMTDGKREIISRLIEEYDIKTAEDIRMLCVTSSAEQSRG